MTATWSVPWSLRIVEVRFSPPAAVMNPHSRADPSPPPIARLHQSRSRPVPCAMVLRMPMEQQHRRTFARGCAVNTDARFRVQIEALETHHQLLRQCHDRIRRRSAAAPQFAPHAFNIQRALPLGDRKSPHCTRLVMRASDMNDQSKARAGKRNRCIEDRVAARVMNPPPVTAAAPLEVSSSRARMPSCSSQDRWTCAACAMNSVAMDK